MHILFVTTYFEPDSGAAAVRLSRLARLLHKRGHHITVLTTMPHYPQGHIAESYRGKFSIVEDLDGIRVVRTWLYATPNKRISRRLLSQLSFMFTASLRGIGLKRPDVIFIEAQPVFTSLAGRFLSFIKRRPYVLNVSDLWPDHLLSVGAMTEDHLAYRLARRLVDSNYRGARTITTLSDPLAEVIAGYINGREKIQAIYNGVDLERFRPNQDAKAFRQKYGLDERKIISFISTFTTPYDFETMLAVIERLKSRNDVQFVFIGSGTQSPLLEERLEVGNLSNLKWLGWIDYQEIPLAWSASHLTFLALRDESLYKTILPAKFYEVMASGVPIACAVPDGGLAMQMLSNSKAGIAVDCNDIDGLTKSIEHLLDDDAFHQQCAQSARAYAEAHFDPERVADAYEAVLIKATQS